jgi:hypothetical protein
MIDNESGSTKMTFGLFYNAAVNDPIKYMKMYLDQQSVYTDLNTRFDREYIAKVYTLVKRDRTSAEKLYIEYLDEQMHIHLKRLELSLDSYFFNKFKEHALDGSGVDKIIQTFKKYKQTVVNLDKLEFFEKDRIVVEIEEKIKVFFKKIRENDYLSIFAHDLPETTDINDGHFGILKATLNYSKFYNEDVKKELQKKYSDGLEPDTTINMLEAKFKTFDLQYNKLYNTLIANTYDNTYLDSINEIDVLIKKNIEVIRSGEFKGLEENANRYRAIVDVINYRDLYLSIYTVCLHAGKHLLMGMFNQINKCVDEITELVNSGLK